MLCYSLEAPLRGASNKYPQNMLLFFFVENSALPGATCMYIHTNIRVTLSNDLWHLVLFLDLLENSQDPEALGNWSKLYFDL